MALGGGGGGAGAKAGDVRAGGAYVEVSAKDSLTKTLGKLQAKVKGFSEGLRKIGVSTALAGAATLTPIAMLLKGGVDRAEEINRLAEELGFTVQEMQRLKYAADVTGDSLERVIGDQEKYADLLAEAPVMDDQAIRDSVAANREWRKTLLQLQEAITPIITDLIPFIKYIGQLIRDNKQLVKFVGAGGVALTTFGSALTAVSFVLPLIIPALGLLGSALGLIGVKGALIGGIFAGAIYAFTQFTEVGGGALERVKIEFNDLWKVASETMGGVVAAISKGDLGLAWDVALGGMRVTLKKFELYATEIWVGIKNFFVDTWRNAVYLIKMSMLDLAAFILRNDPTGQLSGGLLDADINKARDDAQKELTNDVNQEEAKAKAFREKQLADAQAEVNAAKGNLQNLLNQANAVNQVQKPAGGGSDRRFPQIDAVRGAFRVFNGAMQFGGSIAKQQLDVAKEQDKKLAALVGEMNDLNRNLRFA